MVASDAIGMGLNLNIRRIIFHRLCKNDGIQQARAMHTHTCWFSPSHAKAQPHHCWTVHAS